MSTKQTEALKLAQALRAQIGQGVPSQAASDAYDRIDHFLRQKLDDHNYAHYSFDLNLVWGAYTAPQQKPLTDEQINQMWSDAHNDTSTMSLIHVLARAIEAAHNIGEKK